MTSLVTMIRNNDDDDDDCISIVNLKNVKIKFSVAPKHANDLHILSLDDNQFRLN